MLQKKKINPVSTRKLNRIKSEEILPLGSLMQEIGQLKEELKEIKRNKKNDMSAVTVKVKKPKDNKENSVERQLSHTNFNKLSKEHQLKIEIIWGKLCRGLDQGQVSKIKSQLIELVEVFVNQMGQSSYESHILKKELNQLQRYRDEESNDFEQKYWSLVESNKRLERQIEDVKVQTLQMIRTKEKKEEFMITDYQSQKQVTRQLKKGIEQLTKNNFELESIIGQWELQCKNLQQKCTLFDRAIITKEKQIVVLHQDVKYLRLESQKFKSQKRQFEKLWEQSAIDLRQFKMAFEEEVVKAEREKTKWMNQCSMRRHQSEQIQAIEGQKQIMAKEINQIRNNYSLKCKELAETKTLLHELQRKLIEVDSDNFRMATELQKSHREKNYWESEIVSLRKEFDDFSETNELLPRAKGRSKEKKPKQQKMQALDDIQHLIKKFRQRD